MTKAFKVFYKLMYIVLAAAVLIGLVVYSQRIYLKNAYPVKYSEFIEKYSSEYGLDPYFIYAVIRTESDFKQTATSSIGARGLMQVTEETFDWIKGRLGDNASTFDSMYDPETAVRYGVYLISYLRDVLGDEENVLCGYHAGVNRAKEWLSDEKYTQNGNILTDKIPYGDTRLYVNKVMETYRIYLKLY